MSVSPPCSQGTMWWISHCLRWGSAAGAAAPDGEQGAALGVGEGSSAAPEVEDPVLGGEEQFEHPARCGGGDEGIGDGVSVEGHRDAAGAVEGLHEQSPVDVSEVGAAGEEGVEVGGGLDAEGSEPGPVQHDEVGVEGEPFAAPVGAGVGDGVEVVAGDLDEGVRPSLGRCAPFALGVVTCGSEECLLDDCSGVLVEVPVHHEFVVQAPRRGQLALRDGFRHLDARFGGLALGGVVGVADPGAQHHAGGVSGERADDPEGVVDRRREPCDLAVRHVGAHQVDLGAGDPTCRSTPHRARARRRAASLVPRSVVTR